MTNIIEAAAIPRPWRIETRLGAVECVVEGKGPALLAVHGVMGGYDQSWLLARALGVTEGHTVLAVSRPGYLGSPLARARTPEDQADLYAALLDALGVEQALVAAVSAGGPSAVRFAARSPGRCCGLVLVSACLGALPTPRRFIRRMRWMKWAARTPGLVRLLRRGAAARPEAADERAIPDPVLRARTLAHPEAGPLLRALQASVLHRMAARMSGSINDIDLYRTLSPLPFSGVSAPTLIVHAQDDEVVPVSHATAAASAIPGAELLRLEAGGHLALFTHIEEIRARVRRLP